ncbi:MAG: hypothetical protein ACRD1T_25830, partial [Acidimicrobiia bacterium]
MDRVFRIVALVSNAPPNSVVEAYVRPAGWNDQTIGELARIPATPDTWEFLWDIDEDLPTGQAQLGVRLFIGEKEFARDEIAVQLRHKDGPRTDPGCSVPGASSPLCNQSLKAESVSLTWPLQGGPLGFYRSPEGKWSAVVDALASPGSSGALKVMYSTTPIGYEPTFSQCGSKSGTARPKDGIRVFRLPCVLNQGDLPRQVTALSAIAMKGSEESQDALRVRSYVPDPAQMTAEIKPIHPTTMTASYPTGTRRRAGSGCLEYSVVVSDHMGRPVQGANVDVQLWGPEDNVMFGGAGASNFIVPEGLEVENASNCAGGTAAQQGRHVVGEGLD